MEQTVFRLKGNKFPITYTINGGHNGRITTVPREGKYKGEVMAIRHVPSESTIFIKDQSPFAPKNTASPIFRDGYITLTSDQKPTIEYLRSHPVCGKLYEEINTSAIAKDSIEKDEIITMLKSEVFENAKLPKGKDMLQSIACVLTGSYIKTRDMSIDELKKEIYTQIDADPYRFVDEYKNSILFGAENMKRFLIHYCQNNGIIKVAENKKSWLWSDTGSLICNIPNGIMPIDHFCEFLDTDEGMIVTRKMHDMNSGNLSTQSSTEEEKKRPGRPPQKS